MSLRDEIVSRNWRFHRLGGGDVHWLIQFTASGQVINYDHPNERRWDMRDGHFVFLDDAGNATSRFDTVTETNGRLRLAGPHLLGPEPFDVALTSWPAYDPSVPDAASCHIRADLDRDTSTMVITLNGMGSCASGDNRRTDFEMAGFANTLGANRIQIAEREDRCGWYADKASFIASVIAPLCQSYRQIVLIGTSAGGYGAALLAEYLGRTLQRPTASIMINPQTTLLQSHQDEILRTVPAPFIPPTISATARAHGDPASLHLPDAISQSTASHHILYDSGNPAEAYYAALMAHLPSCRLVAVPLGLTHVQGVWQIYRSGLPHQIAQEWLAAAT